MRSEPRRRRTQGGFALVLALWAVAIVFALAATFDRYTASRVEQATAIRDRLADRLDLHSTRATLLYLLGTRRFTLAGLRTTREAEAEEPGAAMGQVRIDPLGDEIALDGRSYHGIGRVLFAVQDRNGMIALNAESTERLESLLAAFGADPKTQGMLLDALADYRDANALKRLNGAEREEYLVAGLEPPPNRNLLSAPELLRVAGWAQWLGGAPGFLMHDWLSPRRRDTPNPNTIPLSLLARLPGMDEQGALAMVAEREREPFRSAPDFQARGAVALAAEDSDFRFFGTDALQLVLWTEGADHAESAGIQLTPLDPGGPWRIESLYAISRTSQDTPNEAPGEYFRTDTTAAR